MTNLAYVPTVSNNRSFSPRRALGRLVLAILAGLTLQAGRVDAQPNPPLLTLQQRLTITRIKIALAESAAREKILHPDAPQPTPAPQPQIAPSPAPRIATQRNQAADSLALIQAWRARTEAAKLDELRRESAEKEEQERVYTKKRLEKHYELQRIEKQRLEAQRLAQHHNAQALEKSRLEREANERAAAARYARQAADARVAATRDAQRAADARAAANRAAARSRW